eukprot:TRINITY_DN2610_c0_g8_i1.p1 TRINITY_DN2610_c0_g8~~TRINITY_DN2610_c0_g8_i1.p1  ORF type:complete len:153 (+),score=25.67 TRINITY_DN2610_c0_g8_i1:29-460(+)
MEKKRKYVNEDTHDRDHKKFRSDNRQAPLPTYEQRLNERETNESRLKTRQNQIEIGKNTEGYRRYIAAVPKEKRERGNDDHPVTPNIHRSCSKRSFDGQLRKWRRLLHKWDPVTEEGDVTISNADLEELGNLLQDDDDLIIHI